MEIHTDERPLPQETWGEGMIQQTSIDGETPRPNRAKFAPKAKCVCCEEPFPEDELYPSDNGLVCDECYSNDQCEPCATVFFNDSDEPCTIGEYHNDTEGVFKVKWHSTDPWRGYYEAESEEYQLMHDDCILSYSEDAEELKDFDTKLQTYCNERNIEYARVFARTSNIFSAGYDFFVKKTDVPKVEDFLNLYAAVADLKRTYRDPERFAMTALTGKSGNFDKKDKLLAKAAGRLFAGDDPDDVIEEVKRKAKKL